MQQPSPLRQIPLGNVAPGFQIVFHKEHAGGAHCRAQKVNQDPDNRFYLLLLLSVDLFAFGASPCFVGMEPTN